MHYLLEKRDHWAAAQFRNPTLGRDCVGVQYNGRNEAALNKGIHGRDLPPTFIPETSFGPLWTGLPLLFPLPQFPVGQG